MENEQWENSNNIIAYLSIIQNLATNSFITNIIC